MIPSFKSNSLTQDCAKGAFCASKAWDLSCLDLPETVFRDRCVMDRARLHFAIQKNRRELLTQNFDPSGIDGQQQRTNGFGVLERIRDAFTCPKGGLDLFTVRLDKAVAPRE